MTEAIASPASVLRDLAGPSRAVAGAGTGKTSLLAARFSGLVGAGVDPQSILVMTFTERASSEMRARIESLLSAETAALNVGTFHAMTQRWLRDDGWRIGLPPTFRILAGAERWVALRELMWDLAPDALVDSEHPDELVAGLLRMLERLKQELVPVRRLREWAATEKPGDRVDVVAAAAMLFEAYEEHCRRERVLDFEDLIACTVRLFESSSEAREAYANRFPWVLVDEYQDTNLAQERLVELLAEKRRNVFVVGDDDQSIYRFRGASRASMERFLARFPEAQTIQLGVNRRSTANIVEAARALIVNNPGRLDKPISAAAEGGDPVEVHEEPDGDAEANWVAARIASLVDAGVQPARIAILLRTNAIGRQFVRALQRWGIPLRLWGSSGLLQQPEVKDVIACLRTVANPEDAVALERLRSQSVTGGVVQQVIEMAPLKEVLGVGDLLFEMLNRTRLLEELEDPQQVANVTRFAEIVDEWVAESRDQSLDRFLAYLDLIVLSDVDEEVPVPDAAGAGGVQVMTIHRSKGLEFDAVFIPSIVEGRLPQARRRDRLDLPVSLVEPAVRRREDHVAEERRLLYVAMTRARRFLHLSWARTYEGSREWVRSRFLDEIEAAAEKSVCRTTGMGPRVVAPAAEEKRASGTAVAVKLSFSSIATHLECPRQFEYRYVKRTAAPPSLEAMYGTLVHSALYALGSARQAGEVVGPDAVEQAIANAWRDVKVEDQRRARVLDRLAHRHVLAYVQSGGFERTPSLLEHRFEVQLDGWTLQGVIDRADAGDPPRLVDYKTGSTLPPGGTRRDLQLALYALAAKLTLGLDEPQLEIVYLRKAQSVSVDASAELVEEAGRTGAAVAEAVAAGRFEPRPERRRCRRCPYRLACDAAL